MFKSGKKYTVYTISDFMAMTVKREITVKELDKDGNAIYVLKGKRKRFIIRLKSRAYSSAPEKQFDGAVFEGWDQPIKIDCESGDVMRGNACFNFIGTPASIRKWIDKNQINPHFKKEHVMVIVLDKNGHSLAERPAYMEMETAHAVINRKK